MEAIKEYDARVDTKKRVTIRGTKYANYRVMKFPNGKIILEPGELVAPFEISRNTLEMMDSSMENIKKGKVSPPVNLTAFSTDQA